MRFSKRSIEQALECALREEFPRKRFKVTLKRNRAFNIQWHDKTLPLKKINRVFAKRWFAIFGERVKFGKVVYE